MVTTGKKERKIEEDDAILKCEKESLEWGGEISNKEFSVEKFKEIITEFIKIIYKKKGNKKEKQNSVDIAKYKKKEKRRQRFC